MAKDAQNAVDAAVKMEQDSIDFYNKAAGTTRNRLGKSMFESFVKDEKRHLDALQRVVAGVAPSLKVEKILASRKNSFKAGVATVFENARRELVDRVPSDADDVKALGIAIELERTGFKFYADAAAKAGNELQRKLYAALQNEENEHLDFLQNTLDYLEDTGNWFLWEEHGLLDGG